MRAKLTKRQFDYLDYSLFSNKDALRLDLQISNEGQAVFIDVDESIANEIRDWASEELQKTGFDAQYELTKEGKILEELIDAFYFE